MRHVRDVDAQGPATGGLVPLHRNRIIEILGLRRIDREDEFAGEVHTPGGILGRLGIEQPNCFPGFLDHGLGKLNRKSAGRDDRLRFDIGFAAGTKHLGDDPFGHEVTHGPDGQLEDDLRSFARSAGMRVTDEHIASQAPAVGLDHPSAVLAHQFAGKHRLGAIEHFLDATTGLLGFAALAAPRHRGADTVTRQRASSIVNGDVEVSLPADLLGKHESETTAGLSEDADDLVAHVGQSNATVATSLQPAFGHELIDGLLET